MEHEGEKKDEGKKAAEPRNEIREQENESSKTEVLKSTEDSRVPGAARVEANPDGLSPEAMKIQWEEQRRARTLNLEHKGLKDHTASEFAEHHGDCVDVEKGGNLDSKLPGHTKDSNDPEQSPGYKKDSDDTDKQSPMKELPKKKKKKKLSFLARIIRFFLGSNDDDKSDKEQSADVSPDFTGSTPHGDNGHLIRPGALHVAGIGGLNGAAGYGESPERHDEYVVPGAELSGDRERQLEQQIFTLCQDRDALTRALRSVAVAQEVPEEMLRYEQFSSDAQSADPKQPITSSRRKKIIASVVSFASVIILGAILILTLLYVNRDKEPEVVNVDVLVHNDSVVFNITEVEKVINVTVPPRALEPTS